jgi:hypothetical protein
MAIETYNGDQINTVLTIVERMTKNGDVQLSILAHALVLACKSTKVDRKTAIEEIGKLWDRDDPLLPLSQSQ